jgi:hypothetical protein
VQLIVSWQFSFVTRCGITSTKPRVRYPFFHRLKRQKEKQLCICRLHPRRIRHGGGSKNNDKYTSVKWTLEWLAFCPFITKRNMRLKRLYDLSRQSSCYLRERIPSTPWHMEAYSISYSISHFTVTVHRSSRLRSFRCQVHRTANWIVIANKIEDHTCRADRQMWVTFSSFRHC